MDGARSTMVGDYNGRSGSSTSSSSSSKYTTSLQKRQRLEQIALSLEEPARSRNSISSARPTNSPQKSRQSSNKPPSRRQTPSQSKSKEKGRPKVAENEENTTIKPDNQQHCSVCKRGVRNTRDLRHCFKCKKCAHATCNSGFISLANTNNYACPECAKKDKLIPISSSNNNVNLNEEEDLAALLQDDDTNRPSCSQSVRSSDEEGQRNVQEDSIASSVKGPKRNRRPRTRSSPQQQQFSAIRSNSSASEEQTSPSGNNKIVKTRISGSPCSSSIGISMTTAEPSNDAQTASEASLSPESASEVGNSRTNNEDTQTTKQRVRRGEGKRGRGANQKKPAASRGGSSMRTRFGGKPTTSLTQASTIYSTYERSGKYERAPRGRKTGKGKGGGRGRRGKVMSAIVKSRGRQPQSSNSYSQNSIDDRNNDPQGRLRSHDENDYVRTAVVSCSNDKFMDAVSLCLVCGGVGRDAEEAMLTCASCAQSYHTYCVNMHDKLNNTILERGWRCLDCTVCEGCGTDKDESNLLLCDECDISYHIYCLEPKLTQIPNGPWRCKWCATCSRCKKQVQSGLDLSTLEGFCETCYSLRKCPKCTTLYQAGDLLIKCQHCIRWFHGRCEDLMTEEQVESASENSFRCTFCRPKLHCGYDASLVIDNVMISRNTFDHVSTLKRPTTNIPFNEASYRPISIDNEDFENEDDPPYSTMRGRGRGGPGRRVLKTGVGGFCVRMTRQRMPVNTPDEKEKDLIFPPIGPEEDDPNSSHATPGKRMRRPRRPRRPKLEEAYPIHIQEAFFGVTGVDSKSLADVVIDEPVLGEFNKVIMEDQNRNLGCELSDQTAQEIQDNELSIFDDFLPEDIDIDLDFSSLMDDPLLNDQSDHDVYNNGPAIGSFGDDKNMQFGIGSVGNYMNDEQNDENNIIKDEEDGDLLTSEQFHAQMEQSHEKQRQIQQQARLQMGTTSAQPNGRTTNETESKQANSQSNAEKTNQATEKWEQDEPLGDKATKAAVLFANTQHANLKDDFPLWSDRVKRINNLWRKLSQPEREVFVKRARENRADVPKRRNRRTTSSAAQLNGSVEDLGEASQDSSHSHLDIDQMDVKAPTNFAPNVGMPNYPINQINQMSNQMNPMNNQINQMNPMNPMNSNGQQQQLPYKIANPHLSIDNNLNGMPQTPMPIPINRPPIDPKMHFQRPDSSKDERPTGPVMGPAEWERYNVIREQHNRMTEQRTKIEDELVKLRKVKKNVKAKVRSLRRSQESTRMNDPNVIHQNHQEINETEAKVAFVTQEIADNQKVLEKFRHDMKDVSAQLQSFESRYQLNQPAQPIPPPIDPQMHFAAPQHPQHPQMVYQNQQQQQQALTSPSYPFVSPTNMNQAFTRQTPYYNMESVDTNFPPTQNFYPSSSGIRLSNFNNLQQSLSPVLSTPPTPPSARPTSVASNEILQKSGRGRKRRRPLDDVRTPRLGNVMFSMLTEPFDREIYSVLDLMLGWVEKAVDSGNENLFNKLPTMRTSIPPSELDSANAAKAKRRRNVVKKPPGLEANEYEAFVEKLQTQLKLCPMPILSYEQSSFIDTSIPQFPDITQIHEEIGQEFIGGSEIDDYHLTFMPNYYSHVEKQIPFDQFSLYPAPMSKIYADVDIDELEASDEPLNNQSNLEPKKEKNNEEMNKKLSEEGFKSTDVDNYELFWRDITADEIGNSYCLPLISKLNDDLEEIPIPPHESVFKSQKKRHLDHRYAVSLTIENMNLDEKVLKELQNLINNPEDLEIIEKTPPPDSPQHAQEVKEEPMGEELVENVVDQICRQCDGLIKQCRVSEFMTKLGVAYSDEDELNTFCSMPCYLTFMAETGNSIAPEVYKHAHRFVDESVFEQLLQSESTAKKIEPMSIEHELKLSLIGTSSQARTSTANLLSPTDAHFDPNYYSFNCGSTSHSNELILRVSDLPSIGQNKCSINIGEYKWKGFGWQIYDTQLLHSFQQTQDDIHQRLSTIQTQCTERNRIYRDKDTRSCSFCGDIGDGEPTITGRLLNVDANEWVHVNCALWSAEVFENEIGVLSNVDVALKRAQNVQCKVCHRTGASLRCFKHKERCDNEAFYHLRCAKQANGKFTKDKCFYCPNHGIRPEVCFEQLNTMRRICIEREENQLLAKIFNHSYATEMMMRVGNMIFRNVGQLHPEQLKSFHSEEHIFPVGYHITRLFWSPLNVREQKRFECLITDDDGQPMFHVQLTNGQEKRYSDRTMAGAWNEIFADVKKIRSKDMLQFYPDLMNAAMLFGLDEPTITIMTESLPGVDQMFDYVKRHKETDLLDLPLAVNQSGCARCEPRFRTLVKHRSRPLITQSPRKKLITNNEFTPDIIPREARRNRSQRCLFTMAVGDENLIQLMRRSGITENMLTSSHVRYETASLHNAHSQYRKMRQEWRNYVYLGRSGIQGLGLYAKKDLDMNTMIIEYVGEIIRSELGEVREKKYLSQNRAIYLFRIDEEFIIDATLTGGLARYINHSCDPNCCTKILQYNDEKKIVIIANRPIKAGEELCYDYQFELEDNEEKLACLCGAPNCVKWMN